MHLKKQIKNLYYRVKHHYIVYVDNSITKKIISQIITGNNIESSRFIILFSPREMRKMDFHNKLYLSLAKLFVYKGIKCFFINNNCLYNKIVKQQDREAFFNVINVLGPHQLREKLSSIDPMLYYNELPEIKYNWKIEFENKTVTANGINFYNVIHNTLRTFYKAYNIDFGDLKILLIAKILIKQCDEILYFFESANNYAIRSHKKLKIVGWESQYIPNGAIFECSRSNRSIIEYLDCDRSYMDYFSGKRLHSYINVINCTKSNLPTCRALNVKDLSIISQKELNTKKIEEDIIKIMNSYCMDTQKLFDIFLKNKKMEKYKKKYVLFAHVFFDTVLEDYTNTFPSGMCEWIDFTIDYFTVKRKNDLLIIKPHPHEEKLQTNETLKDYISSKYNNLPENILFLESEEFNTGALLNNITGGLIWRSSVGLELTYLGIPCIFAGNPIFKGLDLDYVDSLEQYYKFFDYADNLLVTEERKKNIADYFYHIKDYQSKEFIYSVITKYGILWNKKKIQAFLKTGDDNLNEIIKKILSC